MRTNLRMFAVLLAGMVIASTAFSEANGQKKQLGIATYSVKGLNSNVEGAFKSLQDDGFVVMETSDYNAGNRTIFDYSPADYAAVAEKYGMDLISSHARAQFDADDVEGTLEAWKLLLDDHKAMGCKYVILPSARWGSTEEEVKKQCDLLNMIGEEANKRGMLFGYHNHSSEFETIEGTDQILEDFIIANTDPDKVFVQMDVYWVTEGGQDPVAYLKKYPTRFKVLHIKDEYIIGESGRIDFEAIFNQFYKNGYKDWFLEIEETMTQEQRDQMRAMMEQMRERQRQAEEQGDQGQGQPQAGQGGPPAGGFGPPQMDPAQEAERLNKSLDAIAKSAEYLSAASFVK